MQHPRPHRPLIAACLAALSLAVAGCAGAQLKPTEIQHPGQQIFNGYVKEDVDCFKCHNGDARGTARGPSLAVTAKMSDGDILEYINEGEGIMPAFADKLSDEEKAQIVSWLRQEFPVHSPAQQPAPAE